MRRVRQKTTGGVFTYKTRAGPLWGVDYRDPRTGRRRRKTAFPSKEAALRFRARMERQTFGLDPVVSKDAEIKFEVALERFIEDRLAHGRTLRTFSHLVVPKKRKRAPGFWWKAFQGRKLTSITMDEVETLLDKTAKDRSWAPATRNRALAQLSSFLSYARRRRWIETHPIDRGRIPKLPEDNARTRWLRLHELEAVVANSPEWLQVIVRFAVGTGMRLGEICTLTRASYQTDEAGRAYVVTERTKNGERLIWPLEGWLLDYVERRTASTSFPGDHLFPGPGGGIAYSSIRRTLPSAIEAAGMKYGRKHPDGVTFHTFRHSMASLALNHGVPESVVQRMGNWKTRVMVARYAHLADESLRGAAATLAQLVGGKDAPKTRRKGPRQVASKAHYATRPA